MFGGLAPAPGRLDLVARTIEGYRNHRSGRNAALIAHFGFLSVFPLMLVFTTVLGFVLQNNQKLLDSIVDSALAQLPFVGQQISSDPSKLQGDGLVLIFGLLLSLWAGMKAFVAIHRLSRRHRRSTARRPLQPGDHSPACAPRHPLRRRRADRRRHPRQPGDRRQHGRRQHGAADDRHRRRSTQACWP